MRPSRSIVGFAIALAAISAAGSCGMETGPREDARACPVANGEFGTYGCTAISGQVVGARGQPLFAVSVGFLESLDGGQFAGNYTATDTGGRFSLRPIRMAPPSSGASPDSVSLWIRATVVPTLPQMVATIFDSVLVRAKVAPVGSVPDTAHVAITLPVP